MFIIHTRAVHAKYRGTHRSNVSILIKAHFGC